MKHLVAVLVLAVALSGCTTLKKLTGKTDDTVLPGQREEILPPDQQTARDPVVTGQQPRPCNPKITKCVDDKAPGDLGVDDLAPQ